MYSSASSYYGLVGVFLSVKDIDVNAKNKVGGARGLLG